MCTDVMYLNRHEQQRSDVTESFISSLLQTTVESVFCTTGLFQTSDGKERYVRMVDDE